MKIWFPVLLNYLFSTIVLPSMFAPVTSTPRRRVIPFSIDCTSKQITQASSYHRLAPVLTWSSKAYWHETPTRHPWHVHVHSTTRNQQPNSQRPSPEDFQTLVANAVHSHSDPAKRKEKNQQTNPNLQNTSPHFLKTILKVHPKKTKNKIAFERTNIRKREE